MRGTSVTMGMHPMTEYVGVDAAVPGPVDQWQQGATQAMREPHDGRERPM